MSRIVFIEELKENCDLDSSDLEDRLCESLDDFCEGLSKQDGMTRPFDPENDDVDDADRPPKFMWTDKASREIESHIGWCHIIAGKYLTDAELNEITIETNWYKEY